MNALAPVSPSPQAPLQPPLQALDVTSLRAVLAELRPALLPCRFEKAQQNAPATLQLGFRGLERRFWLEISWQAEAPRLLAIDPPARCGAGSTLALQLQHGLGGLALVAIHQSGWERVVELGFAQRPTDPITRTVVVELMGRHSNVFLLDGQRRVVALGRQVREQQSRLRPIATGDAYGAPPPLQGSIPDPAETFEHWKARLALVPVALRRALQEAYQGLSPALALQLAGDRPGSSTDLLHRPVDQLTGADWLGLWRCWQRWLHCIEADQFSFATGGTTAYRCWLEAQDERVGSLALPGGPSPDLPLNRALASYYAKELNRRQFEQRLLILRQRAQRALERERRLMVEQEGLLARVENSDALQERAHALLSGLAPNREEIDQAQVLYRQARKLRRSAAAIVPRIEHHRQRLERIEASLTFLEQADDLEQLDGLESEWGDSGAGDRRQRRPSAAVAAEAPRPLELRTAGGLRVQVGRNHRQNDWISLRQARRGDLWFHAQESPGSHVVLKCSEAVARDDDLQLAADLAAHFSRARGNARVAVVMVPVDQLQRIPGAGAGTVRHRGGERLWAEPGRAAIWLERSATESDQPLPSLGSVRRP